MFGGSKHSYPILWLVVGACGGDGDADPRIAYTAQPGVSGVSQIYVADADGGHQNRLTDLDGEKSDPAWSPDGSRIAFAWGTEQQIFIYTIHANGLNPTRITPPQPGGSVSFDGPTWSPNGCEIAFSWVGGGPLWIISVNGTGQRQLTPSNLTADDPSWAANGSLIVFSALRPGITTFQSDIHTIKPDGTDLRMVTDTPDFHETLPVWSPDGTRIAFIGRPLGGPPDLWVVDANGQNSRRLTQLSTAITVTAPDWSGDGMQIIFSTGNGLSVINADGQDTPTFIIGGHLPAYPDWR